MKMNTEAQLKWQVESFFFVGKEHCYNEKVHKLNKNTEKNGWYLPSEQNIFVRNEKKIIQRGGSITSVKKNGRTYN